MSVSSKKERLECTDLSLVSPPPETTSVETDSELRLRLRSKRPAVDSQVEQSKRSCAGELSIVPWSAPSGRNETLRWTKKCNQRNSASVSVSSLWWKNNDEILWCEMLDRKEELNDENEVNDDHEVVEMCKFEKSLI